METAAVVGTVLVCGALMVRHTLRSLGVGTAQGKPDCGCGSCGSKRKGNAR